MSVQFGIATMTLGGIDIGYLQGVTMDWGFDTAKLYSGAAIYPVDVRTHTGTISGNAEFANLNAVTLANILGGTRTGDVIDLTDADFPSTFQLVTTVVTDGLTLEITFNKVRSTGLSLPFSRDNHVIPNFNFECEADASGNVATINVGDIS